MDDNKTNPSKNQSSPPNGSFEIPQPIYENQPTIPEEAPDNIENMQPEEIGSEVVNPQEAYANAPQAIPDSGLPPAYTENRTRFLIVGGAVVFFLVVFILILSVLFGRKPAKKDVHLTYWGLWEDKEVIQPVIDDYQRKNPGVTIDYQKMVPQEYREKLLARSKNGQGPDIFRFHNTWLPTIQDVITPLPANIMSNSEFEKTFYPIHAKDLKIGNYYYGIPLEIDGLVLIYNNNMFKKAGITQAPTNWDEVIDLVGKLSIKDKDGQLITSGIALGTASNVEHFSDIYGLLLLENGGNIKELTSPEAAQALEVYRKFAEPPNDYWNDTMPNSIVAFAQEKVAMIIAPSWELLTIKAINPDIEAKTTVVPTVPGAKPISVASYWSEGVSRYSKNQLEAWKFIKFLSEKDTMTKLFENASKTRLFGEPYSRVDLASTLAQNQYLAPVAQQAQNMVSLPLVSRTYDNGLNDNIVKYIENAINATMQGVDYSESLTTAAKGVSQVFDTYKIK